MSQWQGKIIDCHTHEIRPERIKVYQKLFDKIIVFSGGPTGSKITNEQVLKVARKYPDFIIPWAYLDMDKAEVSEIDKFIEEGFKGIKIIATSEAYDSRKYFKFYEHIQAKKLPILYHTGYLMVRTAGRGELNLDNYRPIRIDKIAVNFPSLTQIIAHFGNPWWEEAYTMLWKHPNVWGELSGGTAWKRSLELWRLLFLSEGKLNLEVISKLLFGSDDLPEEVLNFYHQLMEYLGVPLNIQEQIYFKNILQILSQS
jgi:predicted TIM-barrel fold metal-dependent hydrolase